MLEIASFGIAFVGLIIAIVALINDDKGNKIVRYITGFFGLALAIAFGYLGFSSVQFSTLYTLPSTPVSTQISSPISVASNIVNTPSPTNPPQPTAVEAVSTTPTGKLVFSDDFEDGLAHGFSFNVGNWQVVDDGTGNKVLEQNMSSDWTNASWGPSNFSDGIIELRLRVISSSDPNAGTWLGIRYHSASVTGYPVFYNFPYNCVNLNYQENGGQYQALSGCNMQFPKGAWITIQVEVQGANFQLFVNGDYIATASDSRSMQGILNIGTSPNTVAQFDDFKVWDLSN